MADIYSHLPPDFYDASLHSANPITRYYHGNRYAKIRRFIAMPGGNETGKGARILDIGCGSASWNKDKLPITGLDQNKEMLAYGMLKGYLAHTIEWNLSAIPLPIKDGSFDCVVISEVLEHVDDPASILSEANRILAKGGRLIITVPLDTPMSAWWALFGIECLVLGDILGDGYYKSRCGHVNHFSPESIGMLVQGAGFKTVERGISMMNIALLAEKT
jgi:2-polyprenyl-3-methyl-5-hydroxy-6-metoxy-1,4-benzoquinol methylase